MSAQPVQCPVFERAASTAYRNYNCRCEVCRAAHSERMSRHQEARTAGSEQLLARPRLSPAEVERIVEEGIQGLSVDIGLVVDLAELARKSVEKSQRTPPPPAKEDSIK